MVSSSRESRTVGNEASSPIPESATVSPRAGEAPGSVPDRPASARSLFEPLEVPRRGLLPEDLPYANEVEAALARRPGKGALLLSLSVGCFFLTMLVWAAFAELDEVTHADGQVIASQRTQIIQNLEGGILRELRVREGEVVEKGQLLAHLDNEFAESSYRDAVNKALEHHTAVIRLEAERGDTEPDFGDPKARLEQEFGRVLDPVFSQRAEQVITDQRAVYRARAQQRQAELEMLESQYQQRRHEVEEQIARKRQLDRSLALAVEQRAIAYPLVQRRNFSRVEYLALQQKVATLQGDVESLAASIPKAQAAAREAEQRISLRKAELDAAVTEEINKRRLELASLRETLTAGSDRVTRTELRSPVRGTVKQIVITTLGGVVKPGESIMEIVPLDDTLLIEAKVRPADVAFLRPGQKAKVKITAYDFSVYGGLDGILEQISADTIEDRRGDFFYLVKVRTPRTAIRYHGSELPIIPGMTAAVDILTGRKTVLDYLIKPILKARENALRER